MRVGMIGNADEHPEETAGMPFEDPPHYIDENEHAEALANGISLALDRLALNQVYMDVPAKAAVGKKHVTTRWENKWIWDSDNQQWIIKPRFVGSGISLAGIS